MDEPRLMVEARATDARTLAGLARSYGVQTSYRDVSGVRTRASREALRATLRALGAPVDDGLDEALRYRRAELHARRAEPVAVSWGGAPAVVRLRVPAGARLSCILRSETSEEHGFAAEAAPAPPDATEVAPTATLLVEPPLPFGYHELHIEELRTTTLIVSAPERAPGWGDDVWGAFLPLYALRSARSWGIGDLTDLEDLMGLVGSLGGRLLATLPLMAGFMDELFEPSPYSPVSRLFWNEACIDVTRVPELASCQEARDAVASPALSAEIRSLKDLDLVDHRRTMALKRSVLELLARRFFDAGDPARREAFSAFAGSKPDLHDYARFRAACEHRRTPWFEWPDPDRSGEISNGIADPDAVRYHEYVQWIAHEQMDHARATARDRGMGMYLDLPVGVNRAGFDVWHDAGSFALGVSVGAPPDPLAIEGQQWGFPPLHPERIRQQGYRHVIDVVRHLFRQADAVRLDHVLGLRRLFWIPEGFGARDGCFVRYPMDELFAIVTLEAYREGTVVVGEDLGIDTRRVRAAMARRGWHRTYVVQERALGDPAAALADVPREAVASPNTHDTPPFAAFWEGLNEGQRSTFAAQVGVAPDAGPRAVLEACLMALASSRGRAIVINLEDLWGETRPQNVPGTGLEVPNWRRRARHSLEDLRRMPEVLDTLSAVNARRTGKAAP